MDIKLPRCPVLVLKMVKQFANRPVQVIMVTVSKDSERSVFQALKPVQVASDQVQPPDQMLAAIRDVYSGSRPLSGHCAQGG